VDSIRHDRNGQALLFPIPGFGSRPRQSPPPPAHRQSDTSRGAADRAARRAPSRRELLLSIIRGAGPRGATIDELHQATGLLTQSVCPVVDVLKREGLIIDSGQRRPTRTGTPAKVWIVRDGKA
jgi:hypothetical protein